MRTFSSYFQFLILASATQLAAADVYKTTDKNGNVTYTDLPPAHSDAKQVELPTVNTVPHIQPMPGYSYGFNVQAPQAGDPLQIELRNPSNGTTLMPEERSINIEVSINQQLPEDYVIAYFLDDTIIEKSKETTATINEPPRGEHKISAEIIDSKGSSYAKSSTNTVIVMRPSIKQKPTKAPSK